MSPSNDPTTSASTLDEKLRSLQLDETPQQTLHRFLSLNKSPPPPPSSPPQPRSSPTPANEKTPKHTYLAHGQCAEIFVPSNNSHRILKRAYPNWRTDLWADFKAHTRVHAAFTSQILNPNNKASVLQVRVPEPLLHILPENENWWRDHGGIFPSIPRTPVSSHEDTQTTERRSILVAERIPPLPTPVQLSLLATFCPHKLKDTAVNNKQNTEAALARVYLGLRRPTTSPPSAASASLVNFELTLDGLEAMNLGFQEKRYYATAMAQGLAVIHWRAGIDGRDIEWVLGGAPSSLKPYCQPWVVDEEEGSEPQDTEMAVQARVGGVCLWVLDFNQCKGIGMDEAGCERAALAFWDNDPYYPRPGSEAEVELWQCFEEAYLGMAEAVIEKPKWKKLPAVFVEAVKAEGRKRFPEGTDFKEPPKGDATPSVGRKKGMKGRGGGANVNLEELIEG
ncbi:MAG: hypothetical protein M1831_006554 [Alyxoria varia]|nr:MAG: hypothetical protein M1831_006554 [Alyxoria varia]